MIAPQSIAEILGLRGSIRTVRELEAAVSAGLPKRSLERLSARLVDSQALEGWDAEDMVISHAFGDQWIRQTRSAILSVPSVMTQGREHNLVPNVEHPQFSLISAGPPETIAWDARLFPRSTGTTT
jgi:hypothetical protein